MRIKSLLWKLLDLKIFSSPAGLMANRIEAVVKTDMIGGILISTHSRTPLSLMAKFRGFRPGQRGIQNNVVS